MSKVLITGTPSSLSNIDLLNKAVQTGLIKVEKNHQDEVPFDIEDTLSKVKLDNFLATGDYKYIRNPIKSKIKIGRNDLCTCGSGKKYKKCCEK
jgi:preprotein translocase subunit SecA